MSVKKPALGKGLSALIPSSRDEGPRSGLLTVPLEGLDANPRQPRRRFDDEGLAELARSIRRRGSFSRSS